MRPRIEVGDFVRVTIGDSLVGVGELRVDHIPCATGDSWILVDVGDDGIVRGVWYVSEGCTIQKLRDAKRKEPF